MKAKITNLGGKLYFDGNFRLMVPNKFKEKLKVYKNMDVYFGISPEDIYESSEVMVRIIKN